MGARFSAPVQTGPGAHPASCTVGTGSFPGVKYGRCVKMTPQPLLVPWSWKGRAIPLLPLQAVRPVQSLSACTRDHCICLHTFRWECNIDTNLAEMELVWTGLIFLRSGTNGGPLEHDNKLSDSTTPVIFFTSWATFICTWFPLHGLAMIYSVTVNLGCWLPESSENFTKESEKRKNLIFENQNYWIEASEFMWLI